jgi:hypothetical protein
LGGENISTQKPYLGLYGNLPINKSYFLFVGLLQLTPSSAYLTSQVKIEFDSVFKAVYTSSKVLCVKAILFLPLEEMTQDQQMMSLM